MAAGDTLCTFDALSNQPPSANQATHDTHNYRTFLDFDDTTEEFAVFSGVMPAAYTGGGLTVDVHFAMSSATTGNVVLTAAIERVNAGGPDIDADSFAAAQTSGAAAVSGTSGITAVATITFTNGAQMDSLVASEPFRIKVSRDATDGSDTAVGDMELLAGEIRETT